MKIVKAVDIPKTDDIYKYSNPIEVQKKANQLYGLDIYRSYKEEKKYMIYDVSKGKFVHFGDSSYEDYTKHKDDDRRDRYLKRAMNIRGDWAMNPLSPNHLSLNLLW